METKGTVTGKIWHFKLFTQEQKGRVRNSEESLWEFWDYSERKNICVMEILKGEDKVTVIKFKAIMSEKLPKHGETYSGSRDPKDSQ